MKFEESTAADWKKRCAAFQDAGAVLVAVASDLANFPVVLRLTKTGVELWDQSGIAQRPVGIDFSTAKIGGRVRFTAARNDPLARALGIGRGVRRIVDATAGLGRDSWSMAQLGVEVYALERSPIVAAVLRDALAAAGECADPKTAASVRRIRVSCAEAGQALAKLQGEFVADAVYLDPMYPQLGKSALGKKEMRVLRLLVGGDDDACPILHAARSVAGNRVVVKRHLHAPALSSGVDFSIRGTRVRYDVYWPIR